MVLFKEKQQLRYMKHHINYVKKTSKLKIHSTIYIWELKWKKKRSEHIFLFKYVSKFYNQCVILCNLYFNRKFTCKTEKKHLVELSVEYKNKYAEKLL